MNPVELIGPSIALIVGLVMLAAMIVGGFFAHHSLAVYLRENGNQDD